MISKLEIHLRRGKKPHSIQAIYMIKFVTFNNNLQKLKTYLILNLDVFKRFLSKKKNVFKDIKEMMTYI